MVSRPVYVNYKKAALDSQRQMLKLANCLSMVGGSLRVLQLLRYVSMLVMLVLQSIYMNQIKGMFY
jgi:hypothetical protein